MSRLVSTFGTEGSAYSALGEIQAEDYGTGEVVSDPEDFSQAVATHLFLSGQEASRAGAGAIIGAVAGLAIMYFHRVGLWTFPLLSSIFAGGAYPAYFVGAVMGAALGAFIASLAAMARPHPHAGPEPTALIVYCPRRQIPAVRKTIDRYAGKII